MHVLQRTWANLFSAGKSIFTAGKSVCFCLQNAPQLRSLDNKKSKLKSQSARSSFSFSKTIVDVTL